MVSPVKKNGAEPEALTKEGGLIQASANGEAITYVADGPMPAEGEVESARNPESHRCCPHVIAKRVTNRGNHRT